MRAASLKLQVKGAAAAETTALWSTVSGGSTAINGGGKKVGVEPRSVLDHGRSPSPPTSTSTLCSSLGGGGGWSTDSAVVAAVSGNPLLQWPPSQDTSLPAPAADAGAAIRESRREDCASFLLPIQPALDGDLLDAEKCDLGMEDLGSMLLMVTGGVSGTAAVSPPSHDQTFLKCITGDVEDPTSLGIPRKHAAMEFEVIPSGLQDLVFGFGHPGRIDMNLSAPSSLCPSSGTCPGAPVGGFAASSTGSCGTNGEARFFPISPGPAHIQGLKGPVLDKSSNLYSLMGANLQLPLPMPPSMFFQETSMEGKPKLLGSGLLLSQQQARSSPQNTSFLLPMAAFAQQEHQQHNQQNFLLSPQPKCHRTMAEASCQVSPGTPDLFLRSLQQQQNSQSESLQPLNYHGLQQVPMNPKVTGDGAAAAQQLVDQLLKAAEMAEAGNFVNAHGILARLNHQLSSAGKPLLRSAFYCKEALQRIVADGSGGRLVSTPLPLQHYPSSAALLTPFDIVLKLSAYKAFSEVSPVLQFANFTCTQTLLEELNGCNRIHIIDFDIGIGNQWSSFMQELAQRCYATATTPASVTPALKITALASFRSNHPLELGLTRENLFHFANDLNIPLEINVLDIDNFEPTSLLCMVQSDEALAVNLPLDLNYHAVPDLLGLVKQLGPKIVVSVDNECVCSEFPFSRYFLHTLQSTTILLDSIDAAGTNPDVANRIEQYLLQPRIRNAFLGCHAAIKVLPWQVLFTSAGFVPLPFSNFTETQADCLLKRFHIRGFHVDKRQQSLLLCWQHGELVSVSMWKC